VLASKTAANRIDDNPELSSKFMLHRSVADQPRAPCQDAKCQALAVAALFKKSPFVGCAVLE
jgi:hypothetical protein